MGVTATVLGFHHSAERGSVLGQSDDELVAGVRSGDAAAFEEIYDRYAPGILAFCAHMLGSREAAEDALQLTLVSAYRALRNGENSIALRPWLYAIARNRCLSELRGRRDALGVDELTDGQPAFEGLADQVLRREDLREMLDDMQRLPADQRAALVLFELGDHPQKEIATVLGVRTEKVKALVFQAREALIRGRTARQHPCGDIREQVATMAGRIPARSLLRAHIDRCPGCQSYEHEVSHQRTALALIVPVALAGELKTSILGSVLHGGGAVAAACGGGGGVVAAGAGSCGSGAVVGGVSAVSGASAVGGASAIGGIGGSISAVSAATASGVAGVGAAATSAPVIAAATGLTAIGESVGVGGLSATGVVAKLLTAAAIATVAASAGHGDPSFIHRATAPPTTRERLLASIPARPSRRPGTSLTGPFGVPLPAPGLVTPAVGTQPSASSTTATTSNGATSTSTSAGSGSGAAGGSTPVAESGLSGAGGPSSAPAGSTAAGSPPPTTTPTNQAGGTAAPASDPANPNPTTPSASTSPASAAAPPADSSSDAASAPVSDSTAAASDSTSSPSTTSSEAGAASTGSADPGSSTSSATGGAASDSSPPAATANAAADQASPSVTDQANVAVQSNAVIAPAAAAQSDAAAASD